MELWIVGIIVAVYLVIGAFVVGRKDESARAIGLVAPVVAVCSLSWYLNVGLAGLDWAGLAVVTAALILFIVGLISPDSKDDIWHYLALGVALLGELIAWGLVALAAWSVNVPGLLIVLVVLAILAGVATWGVRRNRRTTRPPATANQH